MQNFFFFYTLNKQLLLVDLTHFVPGELRFFYMIKMKKKKKERLLCNAIFSYFVYACVLRRNRYAFDYIIMQYLVMKIK